MKRKIILIFFINLILLFAQEQELELQKLKDLKEQNLISEEDYEILKNDLLGISNERLSYYSLSINSKLVSRKYKIINENGKTYFPIKEFFDYIGFVNYEEKDKRLVVYLGNSLTKREIDLEKDGLYRDGVLYISEESFKKIFLSYFEMNKQDRKLFVRLAFDTPKEIEALVLATQEKLNYEKDEDVYIYNSKRGLFDLGYAKFNFSQNFSKTAGEDKYKADWSSSIGYQGGLLYGEISLDYDIKNNELGNISLKYTDIWKYHSLDIVSSRYGKGRAFGINFYKDKSFYDDGGEIVISRDVPIGSRVELIYLGQVIEIQDETDGKVTFKNPLIRTDQTYTLKIYTPDGKITESEIKTTDNYNQQKRHEVEYKLSVNENKSYDRFNIDANVYYGLTDNLTMGVSYGRMPTELTSMEGKNKVEYLNTVGANLTYAGNIYSLAYTLNAGGNFTLDDKEIPVTSETGTKKVSTLDSYNYNYLMQLNYRWFKFIYQYNGYGEFFEQEDAHSIEAQYSTSYLTLGYSWDKTNYRIKGRKSEVNSDATLNLNYSWNSFLFNFGTTYDIENEKQGNYTASIYYSGWQNFTVRLEGILSDDAKTYETKLSLYNSNYGGLFNFSGDISYSNVNKERFTLTANLKLRDWLNIGNSFDDKGSASHTIGVNKVIDLRNPLANIDSSSSSRVKVVTFVDENNNDKFDFGEEVLPGVTVGLSDMTGTTDENGTCMFYGIANAIEYDLKVVVKKPSLTVGNKRLKVKSSFTSTVEAYVPIKPLLSLSGYVEIDEQLGLVGDERVEFLNNLIVELKDLNGKVIETTVPDNEGIFEMSGLFPSDYYVEVTYVGTKYELKSIKKQVELYYSKIDNRNKITLKVGNSFAIEIPDKRMAKRMAKAGGAE